MDGATSQKIAEVLKDPEMLTKIASVVSNLTGGNDVKPADTPPRAEAPALPSAVLPASNGRTAFLTSLKPLLKDDKQHKIDKLITALSIASVIRNVKGGE